MKSVQIRSFLWPVFSCIQYKKIRTRKNSVFRHLSHSAGKTDLLTKMSAKCITTKLLECFLGHLTQGVQGNNLRYLEIKQRIANDAFTFPLLYVNSSDSGVTVRSEKERVVEIYPYSQHDLIIENSSLIWQLLVTKNSKLLKINKKSELNKHNKGNQSEKKKHV